MIGKFGNKPVLTGTRQVSDLAPQTVRSGNSRTSAHDITVHIHRIYRIGDGDEIILTEKFGKVSQVALRSVADKDFRRTESDAPLFEVVFQNGFDQEVISLFRSVAVECTGIRQFPDGPAHRLDASLGKRTGYVADSQTDQTYLRMGGLKGLYLAGHFRKEVASLKL